MPNKKKKNVVGANNKENVHGANNKENLNGANKENVECGNKEKVDDATKESVESESSEKTCCVDKLWEGKGIAELRDALQEAQAVAAESGLAYEVPEHLQRLLDEYESTLPPGHTTYRPHAFEFAKIHGVSVKEELAYFNLIFKVLEHTKGVVDLETRKGVCQLIIAHIDHPEIMDLMLKTPRYMEVLVNFLQISMKSLDDEFVKVQKMSKACQGTEMKKHEEECGLILGAYGNLLGAPVSISDECLENIIHLLPYVNRWKDYWNDGVTFDCVKSLPFGVYANITREPRRCYIICHLYEKEMLDLVHSISKLKYHSDLKSLTYTLNNMSVTKYGRNKFLNDPKTLETLASFINLEKKDCDADVRKFMIITLLHVAVDPEIHELILNPKTDIIGMVLRPITGYGKYSDDEIMRMPNIVCSNILSDPKLERDKDVDTRHAVLTVLWNLCSVQKSREFLRDNGIYYLLRELHTWEAQQSELFEDWIYSEDYAGCLEGLIQILIQTEEELRESGDHCCLTMQCPDLEIGDVSKFIKGETSSPLAESDSNAPKASRTSPAAASKQPEPSNLP